MGFYSAARRSTLGAYPGVSVVPDRSERKLVAILSADLVGYSRLMADDEVATVEAVKATWELCDGLIRQHGG